MLLLSLFPNSVGVSVTDSQIYVVCDKEISMAYLMTSKNFLSIADHDVYHLDRGFTLEWWVQILDEEKIEISFVNWNAATDSQPILSLNYRNQGMWNVTLAGVEYSLDLSDYALTHRLWHHVVLISDTSVLTLGINGTFFAVGTIEERSQERFGQSRKSMIEIGLNEFGTRCAFEEFRFWNQALPEESLLAGMSARCLVHPESLIGYWPLTIDTRDQTMHQNHAININTGEIASADIPSPVLLVEAKSMVVQGYADLIDDYDESPDGTIDQVQLRKVYRTVIQITDETNASYHGLVVLSRLMGAMLIGEAADGIRDPQRDAVALHITGQVVVHTSAQDKLVLPPIQVEIPFVGGAMTFLVHRDLAVHNRLATSTSDDFQVLLEESDVNESQRAVVAGEMVKGIGSILSSATMGSTSRHIHDHSCYHPGVFQGAEVVAEVLSFDPAAGATRGIVARAPYERTLEMAAPVVGRRSINEPLSLTETYWRVVPVSSHTRSLAPASIPYEIISKESYDVLINVLPQNKRESAAGLRRALGANVPSLWERLISRVKDAALEVIVKVSEIAEKVQEAATEVIKIVKTITIIIIEKVGDTIRGWAEKVIKTVNEAFDLIEAGFKQLGIAIHRVIDFLTNTFTDIRGDINETQELLIAATKNVFDTAATSLEDFRQTKHEMLQHLDQTMHDSIKELIAMLDDTSIDTQLNHGNQKESNRTPMTSNSTWLVEKAAFSLTKDIDRTPISTIYTPVQQSAIQTQLGELYPSLIDPAMFKVLTDIEVMLSTAMREPTRAVSALLTGVLKLVKVAISGVIVLIDRALDLLIDLIETLIDGLWSWLNRPLDMPLITRCYHVISGTSDEVSLLKVYTLAVAIPTAILTKMISIPKNSTRALANDKPYSKDHRKLIASAVATFVSSSLASIGNVLSIAQDATATEQQVNLKRTIGLTTGIAIADLLAFTTGFAASFMMRPTIITNRRQKILENALFFIPLIHQSLTLILIGGGISGPALQWVGDKVSARVRVQPIDGTSSVGALNWFHKASSFVDGGTLVLELVDVIFATFIGVISVGLSIILIVPEIRHAYNDEYKKAAEITLVLSILGCVPSILAPLKMIAGLARKLKAAMALLGGALAGAFFARVDVLIALTNLGLSFGKMFVEHNLKEPAFKKAALGHDKGEKVLVQYLSEKGWYRIVSIKNPNNHSHQGGMPWGNTAWERNRRLITIDDGSQGIALLGPDSSVQNSSFTMTVYPLHTPTSRLQLTIPMQKEWTAYCVNNRVYIVTYDKETGTVVCNGFWTQNNELTLLNKEQLPPAIEWHKNLENFIMVPLNHAVGLFASNKEKTTHYLLCANQDTSLKKRDAAITVPGTIVGTYILDEITFLVFYDNPVLVGYQIAVGDEPFTLTWRYEFLDNIPTNAGNIYPYVTKIDAQQNKDGVCVATYSHKAIHLYIVNGSTLDLKTTHVPEVSEDAEDMVLPDHKEQVFTWWVCNAINGVKVGYTMDPNTGTIIVNPTMNSRSLPTRSVLRTNDELHVGESLVSPHGLYRCELSRTGVLAISRAALWHTSQDDRWESAREGEPGDYYAIMQGDGNFCIYAGTGRANRGKYLWGTAVTGRSDTYFVTLKDDGRLYVYTGVPESPGAMLWASPAGEPL